MKPLFNVSLRYSKLKKTVMSTKYFPLKSRRISFLHNKAYVNGEWVSANTGKTFDVLNPANGEIIGNVPNMDVQDVQRAIKAAHSAFPKWSSLTAKIKETFLRKWQSLIEKNSEEIAKIITMEGGKALVEAKTEVTYGISFIDWFAGEARRIQGDVLQSPVKSKKFLVVKQPIGVVSIITPWNFPLAMITRKTSAALAAGCTCVIKPAEDTPFTALALCDLIEQAGIPKGVFNVITSDRNNAPSVGKELCQSPLIAGLSFTGSTQVGKILYQQCASGIKRVALELGGNAPFIVFKTANIDKAVDGAFASKFRNSGQTCISSNRFLIHEDIFDNFVEKLKLKMGNLKLGNGIHPNVNQGPLINKVHLLKIEGIVKDAVSKGAKVVTGGVRAESIGDLFFMPTLLTNISPNMECYVEEIFGPIAVCIKFKTEDEAVTISNSTQLGLSGYFYSNDFSQIWRVANKLEVGMVGINESVISSAEAPFGGVKESGIGREGSHYGIEEFVYIKYICIGSLE